MKNLVPHFIIENFAKNRLSGHFSAFTIFIDISGFTSMTQDLMKHGKEGAEVLSKMLNNVFSKSIEIIYANGGFVSSFAGDAFTSIFILEKGEFPLRAAFEINRLFLQKGLLRTKFGDYRLHVKIGLSFGSVEYRIIPTDTQNIYYFRGEAIDSCAESEHKADKMEIVSDNAFMLKLPASIHRERKANKWWRFLGQNIEVPSHEITIEPFVSQKIERLFVPEVVLELKAKGEFREVAVCFIGFSEESEFIDAIRQIVKDCHAYGGYFNRVDFGDKGGVILVIFGAPTGREKLLMRAADFANQIQNIPGFIFRAGIASGIAFTGFIGSKYRSEYTAFGNTVNLSARLMMQADWMESTVDSHTADKLAKDYILESKGFFNIKGFASQVELFKLGQRAVKQHLTYEGRLIGREQETRILTNRIQPIFKHTFAGIIYVDGWAGIGKSRFINNFTTNLEKCSVSFMPCDEIYKKPFNPLVYFFKNHFMQSDSASDEINKRNFKKIYNEIVYSTVNDSIKNELIRTESIIGSLIGLNWENSLYSSLDPKSRYENTLFAVKNYIKALALLHPLIIIIEDGHWLDDASIDFLRIFIRNIKKYPIALLILARPNDDGTLVDFLKKDETECKTERIEIRPLNRDMMITLLLDTLQVEKIPKKTEDFIWEKSGGNPFYIEQILSYLLESKLLNTHFELISVTDSVPSSINQIIIARIDRLSAKLKETVKAASILGREFAFKVLKRILYVVDIAANDVEIAENMEKGIKKQIWENISELRYIFRHSLIRDAVYEIQLKERLRTLHNIAGEIIEDIYQDNLTEHYEELAEHYHKAENIEKALLYFEKAAEFSKENFRNEKALYYYNMLLKHYKPGKDDVKRIASLIHTGGILQLIGRWEDALKRFREALDLSENIDNSGLTANCMNRLGSLLRMRGKTAKAKDLLEKSLNISHSIGDKANAATAMSHLGLIYKYQGDYDKAIALIRKQREICEEIGDKRGIDVAIANMASIFYEQGDYTAAMDYYRKDLELSKELNDKSSISKTLGNMGVIYYSQGYYLKAMDFIQKKLSICEELGDKKGISEGVSNLGVVYSELSLSAEAMECYKKDIEICEELGDKHGKTSTLQNMGVLYSSVQDYDNALECFQKHIAISREIGDKRGLGRAIGSIGEVFQAKGDYLKANRCFQESLEICEEIGAKKGIAQALYYLGVIRAEQGLFEEALAYYNQSFQISEEIGDRLSTCVAVSRIGTIFQEQGNFKKAFIQYDKSISIEKELDNKFNLCTSLFLKADLLYNCGRKDEAKKLNSQALEIADEINKSDVMFNATVLRHKIEKNIDALLEMLSKKELKEEQVANINYELWKLTGLGTYSKTAVCLYKQLVKKAPKHTYMERIKELAPKGCQPEHP